MRTTLTIDDDIAILVEQEVRRSGGTFKGTVNRLLRDGLTAKQQKTARKPFEITPLPIGVGALLDRHNGKISALLDELDGPYSL